MREMTFSYSKGLHKLIPESESECDGMNSGGCCANNQQESYFINGNKLMKLSRSVTHGDLNNNSNVCIATTTSASPSSSSTTSSVSTSSSNRHSKTKKSCNDISLECSMNDSLNYSTGNGIACRLMPEDSIQQAYAGRGVDDNILMKTNQTADTSEINSKNSRMKVKRPKSALGPFFPSSSSFGFVSSLGHGSNTNSGSNKNQQQQIGSQSSSTNNNAFGSKKHEKYSLFFNSNRDESFVELRGLKGNEQPQFQQQHQYQQHQQCSYKLIGCNQSAGIPTASTVGSLVSSASNAVSNVKSLSNEPTTPLSLPPAPPSSMSSSIKNSSSSSKNLFHFQISSSSNNTNHHHHQAKLLNHSTTPSSSSRSISSHNYHNSNHHYPSSSVATSKSYFFGRQRYLTIY
jgi:hypothetical protein